MSWHQYKWTALIKAAYKGRTEVVDLLIKAGANLNVQTNVSKKEWWNGNSDC